MWCSKGSLLLKHHTALCMYDTYTYKFLRSEVGVLEREHAIKFEALCVLILLYICVLISLYMCPHRSEIVVLETEHAVKVMLPTNLYASMRLTKPLRRSEVAVLESARSSFASQSEASASCSNSEIGTILRPCPLSTAGHGNGWSHPPRLVVARLVSHYVIHSCLVSS